MNTVSARPLAGCRIGLSISAASESDSLGIPASQVNRITLQLAAGLLGQGASVVFGHDWREDGVMEAVHGFAQQIRGPLPAENHPALLTNILPWPDAPKLNAEQRERLRGTLRVQAAPPPPSELLKQLDAAPKDINLNRQARFIALANLREELAEVTDARICLGGRTSGYQGVWPGVIEEALHTAKAGKPLYLSGLLGGATAGLIQTLDESPKKRLARFTVKIKERLREAYATPSIRKWNLPAGYLQATLQETNVEGLAQKNGLSVEENYKLFHTRSLDEMIQLILKGIGNIQKHRHKL